MKLQPSIEEKPFDIDEREIILKQMKISMDDAIYKRNEYLEVKIKKLEDEKQNLLKRINDHKMASDNEIKELKNKIEQEDIINNNMKKEIKKDQMMMNDLKKDIDHLKGLIETKDMIIHNQQKTINRLSPKDEVSCENYLCTYEPVYVGECKWKWI
jgi:chromosome segregation ATPase